MSNRYDSILVILAGLIVVSVLFLLAAIMIQAKLKARNAIKSKQSSGNNIWYTSYLFFSKFFLTKQYIAKVRKRIEILELADNWTIGKNAMKFAGLSFLSSFFVFAVLMAFGRDLYFFVIATLTAYIVHNQIISVFVDSIENKILIQFEKFLGDVRHNFHEHGMIDEAIFDSIEDCGYEMSLHANRIYEVLKASDVEEEIEKYNDMAPNKFFKTFLALCQTVLRFDDKKVENKSMFLTNLNYLKQEINVELLKREKLNYLFKSLSAIAIAPIFAIKPLEIWAQRNLPELTKYYQGAYGFVEPIVLVVLVIISYQLINKLQSNVADNPIISNIEDKILRLRYISNRIDMLINNNYSKSLKYMDLLKNTGSQANIRAFYLKRIIYGTSSFLICIFMFYNIYAITRYNIVNSIGSSESEYITADKAAIAELKKLDQRFILKYKDVNPTYEQIEKDLVQTQNISDVILLGTSADRIYKKILQYNNQYFRWWQLIISFLLASIAYNIPYLLLAFRKKILQMGMEDEVMQFHSIILMLMYIERISVDNILQWMEQFSSIFKVSIGKCLNDFEHGDMEALEQLKIDEPFLPFTRLVENLQAATDKISVEQAFDELIIERGYYQEKRKQDNEMMIAKKALYGKIIAFTPLIATLFLHLLVPFLLESFSQLLTYSEQLKNIL